MAVFLSPVGGVAAQFFTNTGAVLTGGKIYTYAAGTTTPAVTFTNSGGGTYHTNPIVLDAAGRVSGSGEIWLADGISYKFVLKDSNDVLIATYDNIVGINSNFTNFLANQEIQTATANQTVFTLLNSYVPNANTLSVFVDGVNQYGPGAQYAYLETNANTVTFVSGLHVGASVKFTTVQSLTSTQATSAALVSYNEGGTGAVTTTVQAKLRQYVSVFDFMSTAQIADVQANTALVDVTAAIQAAINDATNVYFPAGTYRVNAQITVKSGLMLTGTPSSIIKLASAVTPFVLRGDSLSNIVIENLTFLGNGASGNSTVYISNSSNVLVQNCKITKSGSNALYFVGCSFVKVENCELSENYYYGLEFRDCDGCKAIANLCFGNGNTGVASSGGGRGIMLWRTRGSYIAGNRFVANTEYGFRIYSEAADTTTSNFNVVTGNVFADNTRCDLVLYDEGAAFSFVANNVISDNVIYRTVDTTDLNSVCVLQGDYNNYVNNHIIKSGAFGTDCGFNFFNANYCTISNCSVYNMDVAFSTSSSSHITIDNCSGNVIGKGLTIPTTNIIVRNSKFVHGGAGVTDICIDNTPATGKNFYENNYISGFYQGITLADQAVAIFGNTTVGSTNAGLRKTGNVTATIEAANNSWDTANPFLLSAYSRTGSTHDQAVIKYTGAPVALTWTRGDTVWNEEPAVGSPIGWMCTVAGTPGTWVAMANL
jgi:parallel beta-helix repeat protein